MVKNTQYRLFTAYSDPAAKELGTIYQACNFYYLGNKFGGTERYVSPYSGKVVSDRYFRQVYAYKKYAEELGIIWDKKWEQEKKNAMQWENVPNDIEEKLREQSKIALKKAEKILDIPTKHKYAKKLKKVFVERNKVYEYPKVR
jgi:thymidylate kinase